MYIHMYICIYIYIYTHTYTYIAHTYVCIYIYICISRALDERPSPPNAPPGPILRSRTCGRLYLIYRVSTGVTFGQGALSTFPLAYLFKIAHRCFQCPQGAPQGKKTKGTFVKGHLCSYSSNNLYISTLQDIDLYVDTRLPIVRGYSYKVAFR